MKKKTNQKIAGIAAMALMTGLVLAGCAGQDISTGGGNGMTASGSSEQSVSLNTGDSATDGAASYGEGVVCTSARLPEKKYEAASVDEFVFSDAYAEWAEYKAQAVEASLEVQDGMDAYYANVVSTFLKDAGETSTVCSPFNMYMALSVLAQTTDAETRAQILKLLQVPDTDTLSARVGAFWEAGYADTPIMQELLANSLWLADDMSFEEDTIKRIAEEYHASVFRAPMGESGTDEALHTWINTETKDLLKEFANTLSLDKDTAAAIISTLYYKTSWSEPFAKEGNINQTFHGVKGDTEAEMMRRSARMPYYKGDGFTAVALPLTESGYMIFCLPDEGVSLGDVISNPDSMALFRDPLGEDGTDITVNLSLPKFKVSGEIDMTDALKALGMTDVFEGGKADFTPLTKEAELVLSEAVHACMVETDEDGVTGAAFTALIMAKTSLLAPEETVDFVLDRPFYFAVTSEDNQILFAGTVCDIEE